MSVQKIKKQLEINSALDTAINDNVDIDADDSDHQPLYGGHYNSNAGEITSAFVSSLNTDKRLYGVAIDSIKAQFKVNARRKILPAAAAEKITKNLDALKKKIASGEVTVTGNHSNVYSFIDSQLLAADSKLAEHLQVARSSHDQAAGDLRHWTANSCEVIDAALQNLQAALIDKAEENVKTVFPGYTHMQLTQPISLAHHLMAYVDMIGRDRERFKQAKKRINQSPYGASEFAGTQFNVNRDMISKILGFDRVLDNSIDAVSSYDFAIEFLSCAANCATNLSRMAEEYLLWSSTQYQFIGFSDACIRQDKIMPFKRDVEVLEVVRGRTGKIYGALMNMLTIIKSLPLGFNQDLQEVSAPLFEAQETLEKSTKVLALMTSDFGINRKKVKEAASIQYSTAYDLRDWIASNLEVSTGEADKITTNILHQAISKGKKLSLLDLSELKAVDSRIDDNIYSTLIPSRAIISRRSEGGTNPVKVRKAIRGARRHYL